RAAGRQWEWEWEWEHRAGRPHRTRFGSRHGLGTAKHRLHRHREDVPRSERGWNEFAWRRAHHAGHRAALGRNLPPQPDRETRRHLPTRNRTASAARRPRPVTGQKSEDGGKSEKDQNLVSTQRAGTRLLGFFSELPPGTHEGYATGAFVAAPGSNR